MGIYTTNRYRAMLRLHNDSEKNVTMGKYKQFTDEPSPIL
ncbi:hypothetical protein ENASMMO064B1_03105 [Enterobacter asburiae]